MNKVTYTKALGILGIGIWVGTIFLRETSAVNMQVIGFLLGIAPNIGAVWGVATIFEEMYSVLLKKKYTLKVAVAALIGIFILGLGSEIVHDLFLNSPFDIYDMISTIVASVIYILPIWIKNRNNNVNSKISVNHEEEIL